MLFEILEIFLSVLAVFGLYSILDSLRFTLRYPWKTRRKIRGAVILNDRDEIPSAAEYLNYLRRENKISRERLIILVNDDIIKCVGYPSELLELGEILRYSECEVTLDDDESRDGQCKSCND